MAAQPDDREVSMLTGRLTVGGGHKCNCILAQFFIDAGEKGRYAHTTGELKGEGGNARVDLSTGNIFNYFDTALSSNFGELKRNFKGLE